MFDIVSGYVPFGGRGQRGAAQERDRAQRAACRELLGFSAQEELAEHQGMIHPTYIMRSILKTFVGVYLFRARVDVPAQARTILVWCPHGLSEHTGRAFFCLLSSVVGAHLFSRNQNLSR